MYDLMLSKISILTWDGVQIIITLDPGITSLGLLDTLLIFPVNKPILAQSDLSVLATILSLKISKNYFYENNSGFLVRTLILTLGLKCPIAATLEWVKLDPPHKVI